MPLVLKLPLLKEFDLDLPTTIDPDQNSKVSFRQATQAETEARAELTASASRVFHEDGTIEVSQRWSIEEQKRLEVFLTLAGSNLKYEDETGTARDLFIFEKVDGVMHLAMNMEAFAKAWGRLPGAVAEKIHDKCLIQNPQWNPNL